MSEKLLNNFDKLSRLYTERNFYELTSSAQGLYFLKLRSIARKDYLIFLCKKAGISTEGILTKNLLLTLYINQVDETIINQVIKEVYEQERTERRKMNRNF